MKTSLAITGVVFLFLALITITARAELIDSFDSTPAQSLFLNVPTTTHDESSVTGSGILGGQRDAALDWISGGHYFSMDINFGTPGSQVLEFNQGAYNAEAKGLLIWDGTDPSPHDPKIVNTNLMSVDLTNGGLNTGLAIDVLKDDRPMNLTVTLYSGASNVSQATIALGGGVSSLETKYVPFSAFAGTDPTQVKAVTLLIDGTGSTGGDLTLDNFRSAVPEPASLILLALAAAIGLGAWRWKK